MLIEFFLFTAVATAFTIFPIYNVRHIFARIYRIPAIGFIVTMLYGVVVSWVLLSLFSFKSSVAGLGNLMSSLIFTGYIAILSRRID